MRWFFGLERRYRRVMSCLIVGVVLSFSLVWPHDARGQGPLFLGVTTSTENSGLLAHLIDAFRADHAIQIRAVTAGSGAVLNLAARGDVDVILVHAPKDEKTFIDSDYGIDRREVMRNRFVLVGPKTDPAGILRASDVGHALAAIASHRALFLSRGDESGTHQAERQLWDIAGIDPANSEGSRGPGGWYRESGSGQGATLNIAANIDAYTLTDEATWATFGNPGRLATLYTSEEAALGNIYSVIRVNPERHPSVNAEDALTFVNWLTSKAGQAAIQAFTVDDRILFRPISRLAG